MSLSSGTFWWFSHKNLLSLFFVWLPFLSYELKIMSSYSSSNFFQIQMMMMMLWFFLCNAYIIWIFEIIEAKKEEERYNFLYTYFVVVVFYMNKELNWLLMMYICLLLILSFFFRFLINPCLHKYKFRLVSGTSVPTRVNNYNQHFGRLLLNIMTKANPLLNRLPRNRKLINYRMVVRKDRYQLVL